MPDDLKTSEMKPSLPTLRLEEDPEFIQLLTYIGDRTTAEALMKREKDEAIALVLKKRQDALSKLQKAKTPEATPVSDAPSA